jgi:hypothetical protein
LFAALILLGAAATLSAQGQPPNKGFVTIKAILDRSCAQCHDWTTSYDTLVTGERVVPGSPEKSALYQKVASDEMPADGPKLSAEEKAYIRGWIAAGAPSTDLPIAVPAAETTGAPAASPGFNKVLFHEITGFASTGMFAAAGVIGVVHFLDMMHQGHIYRDAIPFTEGMPDSLRVPWVERAWGDDAALRWWHVGLLIGGETLYLGDAVTGISMWTTPAAGKFTRHDWHKVAFFTHASLMIAQVFLGLLETDALSRGAHDEMIAYGAAHAGVGVAIPAVMLIGGLENILGPE